jgi:peptide subunit release factor 1 (eRF1)
VGVINMSQYASEDEIRGATLELLREKMAEKDIETVERLNTAAKSAAGLGTLGVESTLEALSNGQAEELVVSSTFDNIRYNPKKLEKVLEAYAPGDDNSSSDIPEVEEKRQVGDELLIRAMNSAARITFVQDPELLKDIGGVGAILRYSMNASAQG